MEVAEADEAAIRSSGELFQTRAAAKDLKPIRIELMNRFSQRD
jgi:hypothetical protein